MGSDSFWKGVMEDFADKMPKVDAPPDEIDYIKETIQKNDQLKKIIGGKENIETAAEAIAKQLQIDFEGKEPVYFVDLQNPGKAVNLKTKGDGGKLDKAIADIVKGMPNLKGGDKLQTYVDSMKELGDKKDAERKDLLSIAKTGGWDLDNSTVVSRIDETASYRKLANLGPTMVKVSTEVANLKGKIPTLPANASAEDKANAEKLASALGQTTPENLKKNPSFMARIEDFLQMFEQLLTEPRDWETLGQMGADLAHNESPMDNMDADRTNFKKIIEAKKPEPTMDQLVTAWLKPKTDTSKPLFEKPADLALEHPSALKYRKEQNLALQDYLVEKLKIDPAPTFVKENGRMRIVLADGDTAFEISGKDIRKCTKNNEGKWVAPEAGTTVADLPAVVAFINGPAQTGESVASGAPETSFDQAQYEAALKTMIVTKNIGKVTSPLGNLVKQLGLKDVELKGTQKAIDTARVNVILTSLKDPAMRIKLETNETFANAKATESVRVTLKGLYGKPEDIKSNKPSPIGELAKGLNVKVVLKPKMNQEAIDNARADAILKKLSTTPSFKAEFNQALATLQQKSEPAVATAETPEAHNQKREVARNAAREALSQKTLEYVKKNEVSIIKRINDGLKKEKIDQSQYSINVVPNNSDRGEGVFEINVIKNSDKKSLYEGRIFVKGENNVELLVNQGIETAIKNVKKDVAIANATQNAPIKPPMIAPNTVTPPIEQPPSEQRVEGATTVGGVEKKANAVFDKPPTTVPTGIDLNALKTPEQVIANLPPTIKTAQNKNSETEAKLSVSKGLATELRNRGIAINDIGIPKVIDDKIVAKPEGKMFSASLNLQDPTVASLIKRLVEARMPGASVAATSVAEAGSVTPEKGKFKVPKEQLLANLDDYAKGVPNTITGKYEIGVSEGFAMKQAGLDAKAGMKNAIATSLGYVGNAQDFVIKNAPEIHSTKKVGANMEAYIKLDKATKTRLMRDFVNQFSA